MTNPASTRPQSAMLPILAVLVCAALQILTPLLPQLGVGESIGSQSDNVETLVTPAGWAFSIWGALYTGGDGVRRVPGASGAAK